MNAVSDDEFNLIQFFHESTKRNIYYSAKEPDINTKPPAFKEISSCIERIVLPKEDHALVMDIPLSQAILRRRSCRNFSYKPMTIENISKILWYSQGISEVALYENFEIPFRPCPSAGALYPLELYPVIFNIEGLKKGIYHYSPIDHSLELLKEGDFSNHISQLFMRQFYISGSSMCIIISAVVERTAWKYGSRGYRYILLEAGHVAQNICLIASAENLDTLTLGGFFDNLLANFLGVDPLFEPLIYGLAIGYQKC
jgi:SagB-type dehydrogenase family enzyme